VAGGGTRRVLLMRLWLVLGLLLAGMSAARAADPDALWKIVHGRCVPDQQANGDPKPCEMVSLQAGEARGYAILKDIRGETQFLLIPTARIEGIESPAVLAPDAPDYFRLAWAARDRVFSRVGHSLPDSAVSLAINSRFGRTQEQLHIHIDCIRADVRDALAAHAGELGGRWAVFPTLLAGRSYRAMLFTDAARATPFALLAASLADPTTEMARHTLVLTAVDGGFVLLDDAADAATGDRGSGEELQDHSCSLARQ